MYSYGDNNCPTIISIEPLGHDLSLDIHTLVNEYIFHRRPILKKTYAYNKHTHKGEKWNIGSADIVQNIWSIIQDGLN